MSAFYTQILLHKAYAIATYKAKNKTITMFVVTKHKQKY